MNDKPPIDEMPVRVIDDRVYGIERGERGAAQLPAAMTATQARVDAVAALTSVALSKAGTLQLTQEETERLTVNFADSDFLPGAAGKENLIYCQHAALRDRLNSVLGLGQWALVVREAWNEDFKTGKGVEGVRVYVRAMMLVRGCYVAEAVGDMDYYPSNGQQNYGDAFEGSKTAAFRRCAKEFGVGLQAWRKDWCEGWWTRKRKPAGPAPAPPAKPVPTPRAMTPAERKDTLLAKLKGLEAEATKVFIEEGVILETESFEDIDLTTIERMSPENMLALIKTVKNRKADNDQVPGAEVPEQKYYDKAGPEGHPDEMPGALEGTIEEVNQKDGKTKAGKPWVKYGVKIDGGWLNTFSQTDYETAAALKGQSVRYTFTETKFGKDLLTIESAEENTP